MEAFVRGFGKFHDRRFRFAAGAQLFVGANEAGKTTLQRFLLAMLFGLKREDRRRRDYLPEYDLYRPWNGAPYGGSLSVALDDGRHFEVQRVLERQEEDLRLFDAISGREMTAEFPLDHRKERPFMQSQLQLSRQLFEATTSLGQLAGRLSEGGAGALRERIQGLLDSGDENLSARLALSRLQQLRDLMGSERTPTRGLGMLLRRRRDLQRELEEAEARHREILELHAQRDAVAAMYGRYERAWEERRRAEVGQERQQLGKRLQRIAQLDGEIEELASRLTSVADVAELEVTAYPQAREMTAAFSALAAEIRGRRDEIESLQASLEEWRGVTARLQEALGGFDPAGIHVLEQRAEGLRETLGRVRESRSQEEEERRRNRAIVEALQAHRGRDWTDDVFMGRLAATQALLAGTDAREHEEAARLLRRAYRRQGLRTAWQLPLLGGGVAALAVGFWDSLRLLPGGPWLPLAAALVLVAPLCMWSLRRLVRARDRLRAASLQAEDAAKRLLQAKGWLDEALRRNGMQRSDELEGARREYETLRAQAEHISPAGRRERPGLEAHLAELAEALHAQVRRCDLEALAALRTDPQAVAHGMPLFEESLPEATEEASDPPELRRLGEDLRRLPALRHACAWAERLRIDGEARQRRLDLERRALEERQTRASRIQEEVAELLRRNGARDLGEFASRVGRYQERQSLLGLLRPLQRERDGVLGGETPEALRNRLRQIEATATRAGLFDPTVAGGRGLPADLSSQPLENLGRRKDELAAQRAQLGERLASRESEGRLPAEIVLEVQEVEERIEAETKRLGALQLAMETLERVATTRHREAAPRMNERVGQLFGRLSGGQHREVRLDEDLTPRVRMDGEGFCGAENLSGGAADQLYFALRVTAGEQLARAGEFLPLLLDDPFVQYDPDRLQAGLELVAQLAREHQVLFFTCETGQAEGLASRLQACGVEHSIERL